MTTQQQQTTSAQKQQDTAVSTDFFSITSLISYRLYGPLARGWMSLSSDSPVQLCRKLFVCSQLLDALPCLAWCIYFAGFGNVVVVPAASSLLTSPTQFPALRGSISDFGASTSIIILVSFFTFGLINIIAYLRIRYAKASTGNLSSYRKTSSDLMARGGMNTSVKSMRMFGNFRTANNNNQHHHQQQQQQHKNGNNGFKTQHQALNAILNGAANNNNNNNNASAAGGLQSLASVGDAMFDGLLVAQSFITLGFGWILGLDLGMNIIMPRIAGLFAVASVGHAKYTGAYCFVILAILLCSIGRMGEQPASMRPIQEMLWPYFIAHTLFLMLQYVFIIRDVWQVMQGPAQKLAELADHIETILNNLADLPYLLDNAKKVSSFDFGSARAVKATKDSLVFSLKDFYKSLKKIEDAALQTEFLVLRNEIVLGNSMGCSPFSAATAAEKHEALIGDLIMKSINSVATGGNNINNSEGNVQYGSNTTPNLSITEFDSERALSGAAAHHLKSLMRPDAKIFGNTHSHFVINNNNTQQNGSALQIGGDSFMMSLNGPTNNHNGESYGSSKRHRVDARADVAQMDELDMYTMGNNNNNRQQDPASTKEVNKKNNAVTTSLLHPTDMNINTNNDAQLLNAPRRQQQQHAGVLNNGNKTGRNSNDIVDPPSSTTSHPHNYNATHKPNATPMLPDDSSTMIGMQQSTTQRNINNNNINNNNNHIRNELDSGSRSVFEYLENTPANSAKTIARVQKDLFKSPSTTNLASFPPLPQHLQRLPLQVQHAQQAIISNAFNAAASVLAASVRQRERRRCCVLVLLPAVNARRCASDEGHQMEEIVADIAMENNGFVHIGSTARKMVISWNAVNNNNNGGIPSSGSPFIGGGASRGAIGGNYVSSWSQNLNNNNNNNNNNNREGHQQPAPGADGNITEDWVENDVAQCILSIRTRCKNFFYGVAVTGLMLMPCPHNITVVAEQQINPNHNYYSSTSARLSNSAHLLHSIFGNQNSNQRPTTGAASVMLAQSVNAIMRQQWQQENNNINNNVSFGERDAVFNSSKNLRSSTSGNNNNNKQTTLMFQPIKNPLTSWQELPLQLQLLKEIERHFVSSKTTNSGIIALDLETARGITDYELDLTDVYSGECGQILTKLSVVAESDIVAKPQQQQQQPPQLDTLTSIQLQQIDFLPGQNDNANDHVDNDNDDDAEEKNQNVVVLTPEQRLLQRLSEFTPFFTVVRDLSEVEKQAREQENVYSRSLGKRKQRPHQHHHQQQPQQQIVSIINTGMQTDNNNNQASIENNSDDSDDDFFSDPRTLGMQAEHASSMQKLIDAARNVTTSEETGLTSEETGLGGGAPIAALRFESKTVKAARYLAEHKWFKLEQLLLQTATMVNQNDGSVIHTGTIEAEEKVIELLMMIVEMKLAALNGENFTHM